MSPSGSVAHAFSCSDVSSWTVAVDTRRAGGELVACMFAWTIWIPSSRLAPMARYVLSPRTNESTPRASSSSKDDVSTRLATGDMLDKSVRLSTWRASLSMTATAAYVLEDMLNTLMLRGALSLTVSSLSTM